MEDQLKEKEDGITNIESQMQEQLEAQIKVYKEQTAKKKEEEVELTKVMNDYKTRFNEFDKSMKQSRKTLTAYEKEISNMNKQINQLKSQKEKVTKMAHGGNDENQPKKKKNKKKQGAQAAAEETKGDEPVDLEVQVAEMKAKWEQEKQALMDEKAKIQTECQEIQAQIKTKKEGGTTDN